MRSILALLATAFVAHAAPRPPLAPVGTFVHPVSSALVATVAMLRDPAPGHIATLRTEPHYLTPVSQYLDGVGMPDCVGCGWADIMRTQPPQVHAEIDETWALTLWRWARDHGYDPSARGNEQSGSDPLVASRWLRGHGYLTAAPRRISTEHEARIAVLTQCPLGFATPWYQGMDTPDATGMIHRSGIIEGEHYLEAIWFDQRANQWVFVNSWVGYGPYDRWNQRVTMSAADVRRLIAWGGYFIVPSKSR